jgi:alkanesulfonate monooxygenase SsuD/methylene tetrahydromethanopterin reductase-like flavin-dependent oxidoreductase (luciferase family)
MKASFLATATYAGPAPRGHEWPTPPSFCDRETASRSMKMTLESCRRAEALGFDWISLSEHHYAPMMLTPNPLVMAGAVSQVTKSCKIALLGPLLPLANPVRVAEEIAMLDSISGGRVVVLFLRGTPSEHHVYGDVAEHSRAMTQEGIDLILKAWTSEEPFAWEGEHFQFPTVSVWPRGVQEPHPVTFGSGNSDESVVFAAKRRLSMGMSFAAPDVVKRWIELYREEAKTAGWTPGPEHILYRGTAHLAESDAAARAEFMAITGRDPADMPEPQGALAYIMRPYFFGSPGSVTEQIAVLRDLGVGTIDMGFQAGVGLVDYEGQARQMELFAREVLPSIRAW